MKDDGSALSFAPWTVNMMDPAGDFAPNNIHLFYYKEPTVKQMSSQFAYADEEKLVTMEADFEWGVSNDLETFKKHANFTCRFTSDNDAALQVTTRAIFEESPIGQFKSDAEPNQIRCRTPMWNKADTAKLEVSVNGQDYFGAQAYTFVEKLTIQRVSPMSGPIGGSTKVNIYASGINASIPVESGVFVKFGTIESDQVSKEDVSSVSFYADEYHNELHIEGKLLKKAEHNNAPLDEGTSLYKYISAMSPDISRAYEFASPDINGMGGPVAM